MDEFFEMVYRNQISSFPSLISWISHSWRTSPRRDDGSRKINLLKIFLFCQIIARFARNVWLFGILLECVNREANKTPRQFQNSHKLYRPMNDAQTSWQLPRNISTTCRLSIVSHFLFWRWHLSMTRISISSRCPFRNIRLTMPFF